MSDWTSGRWRSHDGLSLHYRDYGGTSQAVICLPGRAMAEAGNALAKLDD